ncbi:MAG TPA: mechanosensitive ion channel family protein [Sporichthyaceae bacterium]|jgi:small conductance mechanosensitive channel|nr:mechanosensitive ion channel family protein [Sporichthyaceae bacterium]
MAVVLPAATPVPSPGPVLFQNTVPCYERAGASLCKEVQRLTHSNWLAQSSDWLITKPARILMIIIVAALLKKLSHRAINRLCERAATASVSGVITRGRLGHHSNESTLANERRRQRAATMASVLQSIATGVIYAIALLMTLSELTFNIGPLIASAGIIGVAIGFGSQSLVKDFLSGVFMVLEDQYGVGDWVDLGNAKGVVESVGLRVTRVRDIDGTVWFARNGEILRVGNKSQGWARAVLDIDVAYDTDIAHVRDLLLETATQLFAEPQNRGLALEPPEVWGVQALSSDSVVMRLAVKTQPLKQWAVARMLRERIKTAFDAAGIEIPFPQRSVWVRHEEPPATQSEQDDGRARPDEPWMGQ